MIKMKKYYLLLLIIPAMILVQAEAQTTFLFTPNDAQIMLDAITLLDQQKAQQAKDDSDQRRDLAVTFINTTIKSQLIQNPSGTYLMQHTQILYNIRLLEDEIKIAQNGEMANELRKLLNDELLAFKQIKQLHAQGLIT